MHGTSLLRTLNDGRQGVYSIRIISCIVKQGAKGKRGDKGARGEQGAEV